MQQFILIFQRSETLIYRSKLENQYYMSSYSEPPEGAILMFLKLLDLRLKLVQKTYWKSHDEM